MTGVRLRDTDTGEERDLAVGGLFIAIGHEPRSELVARPGRPRRRGLHPRQRRRAPGPTSTGVFAAGDVVDHIYRQADDRGRHRMCQAALDAERYLAALADSGTDAGAGMPRAVPDAS